MDGQAQYSRGNQLWRTGALTGAESAYREAAALSAHPDIRLNLGNLLLGQGRDEEGWRLYQSRVDRRTSAANSLGFPEWTGEPLEGRRLFIWPEQGLGDQIFAARYLRGLSADHVTLVTPPSLARLFSGLADDVVPRTVPFAVGSAFDYWTLPLCLPQWALAQDVPYLKGRAIRSGGIGVAWRGNAEPDPGRSLPVEVAADLLKLPGAISLHPEDTGARDFQDTADLIAGLDLVVSIDTSIAHLAGAMGKRVIVLLQHGCVDWRWRECSPWYPSAEIRRQPAPGDWGSAVAYVSAVVAAR